MAVLALLIVGGVGAYFVTNTLTVEAESETSYREYTVSTGNITVGTEESGTLTIDREYITFPVSAEIEEIYVNIGTKVEEGDIIMKVSADDVADAIASYEKQLKTAQSNIKSAQLAKTTGLVSAQQTLEASLAKGSSAQDEYDVTISKLEETAQDAKDNLTELQEELEEYLTMQETYAEDYAKLCEYEDKLEELEAEYSAMEKIYRSYQKIDTANKKAVDNLQAEYDAYVKNNEDITDDLAERKERYETAKEAYESALSAYEEAQEDYEDTLAEYTASTGSSSDSDDSSSTTTSSSSSTSVTYTSSVTSATVSTAERKVTQTKEAYKEALEEYNAAKIAYNGYYTNLDDEIADIIEDYEDQLEELQDIYEAHLTITEDYAEEMEDFNDEISDYREEYEDYNDDFTDTYGNNDENSINDNIASLTKSIASAELTITSNEVSSSTDILNAEQEKESALSEASTAQEIYDNTVAEYDDAIEDAQDEYDELLEEYEKFMEPVDEEGNVYATCAGSIVGVYAEEGDTITANGTLASIMDTRGVYIDVSISEEDITSMYVGQACSVEISAYEGQTYDASIYTIGVEPARSSGSVTYTVTVKIDDESGINVYEGMTADVTILEHQVENVLSVNVNAITFKDGVSYVTVYDESGNIVQKEVTTGFTDGRTVEIVSGVSAGDKVLAEVQLS